MFYKSNTRTLIKLRIKFIENECWDFPGGTVVGSPPANAGDPGSIPGPGGSHVPRRG